MWFWNREKNDNYSDAHAWQGPEKWKRSMWIFTEGLKVFSFSVFEFHDDINGPTNFFEITYYQSSTCVRSSSDCHSVLCIPVDETFRFKNKTPPSDSIALRKPCCCASIGGNRLLSSVSSFTVYLYNIHSLLILGVGKGKIWLTSLWLG